MFFRYSLIYSYPRNELECVLLLCSHQTAGVAVLRGSFCRKLPGAVSAGPGSETLGSSLACLLQAGPQL